MIDIRCHSFGRGEKVAGLYKISFDDEWFYIGSSVDLKKRFRRWKSVLNTKKHKININILSILPSTKKINISIIEVIDDADMIRLAEENLLSKYWDNKLLLNRCPSPTAAGVTGLRPYNGYVKPVPKKRVTSGIIEPSQPVAIFDSNGVLVNEFNSKGECCRAIGTRKTVLNKHLRGEYGLIKGFSIKSKDINGEYVTPPLFKGKRGGKSRVEKFYQINSNGEIVREYETMNEAARELKASRSHVSEVLRKKDGQVTVKGYRLVYAKEFDEINYTLKNQTE